MRTHFTPFLLHPQTHDALLSIKCFLVLSDALSLIQPIYFVDFLVAQYFLLSFFGEFVFPLVGFHFIQLRCPSSIYMFFFCSIYEILCFSAYHCLSPLLRLCCPPGAFALYFVFFCALSFSLPLSTSRFHFSLVIFPIRFCP